jgi:acyl-ACP thioesterase
MLKPPQIESEEERLPPRPEIWTEQFKVHSYDVDLNKKATLESLCQRFQEAAWNHAEALGVGFQQLQQQGRFWALSRLLLQIDQYPRWGESVTIKTWPRAARAAFAMRDFEMYDADGKRLLAGTSGWLVVDSVSRKPKRVDKLMSDVVIVADRKALHKEPGELPGCDHEGTEARLPVRYSDLDVNGHVNNARYVGWILDVYPMDFHKAHKVASLQVNYLRETVGGEQIAIWSKEVGTGEYMHSIVKCIEGTETCRARIIWKPEEHREVQN